MSLSGDTPLGITTLILSGLSALLGGAAWVGRLQSKVAALEKGAETFTEKHADLQRGTTEMVQRITAMETSLKNVDRNVERLLSRREDL